MKSRNVKQLVFAAVVLVALATFSSCNRGVGCPTFSVDQPIEATVPQ